MTLTKDEKSDIGSTKKSGKQGSQVRALHGNRKVIFIETPDPSEVLINSSHLYPDLLKYSFEKVGVDPSKINDLVSETLEHEYGHHVPGLGEDKLIIRYGVSFLENKETGYTGCTPFIRLAGETRARTMRAVFNGPKEKSRTDSIFLKK